MIISLDQIQQKKFDTSSTYDRLKTKMKYMLEKDNDM